MTTQEQRVIERAKELADCLDPELRETIESVIALAEQDARKADAWDMVNEAAGLSNTALGMVFIKSRAHAEGKNSTEGDDDE